MLEAIKELFRVKKVKYVITGSGYRSDYKVTTADGATYTTFRLDCILMNYSDARHDYEYSLYHTLAKDLLSAGRRDYLQVSEKVFVCPIAVELIGREERIIKKEVAFTYRFVKTLVNVSKELTAEEVKE